jgi:hypothetical protein
MVTVFKYRNKIGKIVVKAVPYSVLRNRLLDQGYKKIRLIRSLKKFIFRYQYLVEIYSVSAEKIISDAFSYSENGKVRTHNYINRQNQSTTGKL